MKKLSDAVGRNFLIFDFLIDVRIIKTPTQNSLTSTPNHHELLYGVESLLSGTDDGRERGR